MAWRLTNRITHGLISTQVPRLHGRVEGGRHPVPRLQRSLDNDVHCCVEINQCVERAVKFDFHTGSPTTRCPTWNGARPRRWSWSSKGRSSYRRLDPLYPHDAFPHDHRLGPTSSHHHHHDRSRSRSARTYSALDRWLLSSLKNTKLALLRARPPSYL